MELVKNHQKMSLIDAHCHLGDIRLESNLAKVIEESVSQGIQGFVLGGVSPGDWKRQKSLKKQYDNQIYCTFGLHPYWVAENTDAACQEALDALKTELPLAQALGETGLDFRAPFVQDQSKSRQVRCFEAQITLAKSSSKPLVLHVVRAHHEVLAILKDCGSVAFMVHSFNGPWEVANEYLSLGGLLSVGGPLLRKNNMSLKDAVQRTPLSSLMVESDAPDQPPPILQGQLNHPVTIVQVIEEIARLKGLSAVEVGAAVLTNTRRFFNI